MLQKTSSETLSWLSVSPATKGLLVAAAQSWEDTETSEYYIRQALNQPETGFDVLVGAYRYYFYKNQDSMALEIATTVCDRLRQIEQWPTDWAVLKPILLEQIEESNARLYINAYAASGLLQARLGNVEVAQEIANRVQQLQAKEFGADVLLNILNPSSDDDDDESEED